MTPRSYFDFPVCRAAFAAGQSDARPEVMGECYYRRRGRNHVHMTLLSFADPYVALGQLKQLSGDGARVQSVNFTYPVPEHARVKKGPTEYWMADKFNLARLKTTGKSGQPIRAALKEGDVTVDDDPPMPEVLRLFNDWAAWAKTRHFMVFTGHYLAWLKMHHAASGFETPAPTRLIGVRRGGQLVGIFGWEILDGFACVTVAKHVRGLSGRRLWIEGLTAIGQGQVFCGSTADDLKIDLGLEPRSSWQFKTNEL